MTIQKKIDAFCQKKNEIDKYETSIAFLTETKPLLTYPTTAHYPRVWESRLGNSDSYERFKNFWTAPNEGHDLVSQIWDENGKAFAAKDANVLFIAKNNESKETPTLNLMSWWANEGYKLYQTQPNSFALLNFEDEKWTIQHIPTKSVMYFEDDREGVAIELIYKISDTQYVRLASDVYEILNIVNGKVGMIEPQTPPISGLNFWHISSNFSTLENRIRTNVMKNSYEQVADFMYDSVLCKINESYLHANVIERAVSSLGCSYQTIDYQCQAGYLVSIKDAESFATTETGAKAECPECRKHIAPGTEIKVPIQQHFQHSDSLKDSIKFVSPDPATVMASLEIHAANKRAIFAGATGKGMETDVNKNFNSELSILYAAESQIAVLKSIQKDIAQSFYISAQAVARAFGFEKAILILGDNFMLFSVDQLLARKAVTDTNGLTQALRIDEQLLESHAKGNDSELRRGRIIMQLNYILGFDATRRAVTMYEIEKQPISSSTKFETEQIKEILTFAETIKLNNEKTL